MTQKQWEEARERLIELSKYLPFLTFQFALIHGAGSEPHNAAQNALLAVDRLRGILKEGPRDT